MTLKLVVPNFGFDLVQALGGAQLPAETLVVVDRDLDQFPAAPPDPAPIAAYVNELANAGYTVLGYLGTGLAQQQAGTYSVANITARVNAWYDTYGGGRLAGIYFDEGSEDPTNQGFYSQLHAVAKPRGLVAMAFADATHSWIAGVADLITLWERDQDLYLNELTRPDAQFHTWKARAAAAQEAANQGPLAWCGGNVINTVGACNGANLQDVVNAAVSRDIGYLYPYDKTVEPGIYDRLSTLAVNFAAVLAKAQDLCQPIVDAINTLQEEEASGVHIPGYYAQLQSLENQLRACRCLDQRPTGHVTP